MAKKSFVNIRLINEEDQSTGTVYYTRKTNKGMKANNKLRFRKYDPVLNKHCWFVEKKLPNPKK